MARNTYGMDLGSFDIKIYDKNQDKIWKEKTVIAIENKVELLAVGNEAYEMVDRNPSNIRISFPMKSGVISEFDDMTYLLQNLIKDGSPFTKGSEYVIAVPTDVSEVQKKAFFDLVIHSTAKAREVNIVERSIADAIGMGLDIQRNKGVLIANIGAETSEFSVLSEGGMILSRLEKIGGRTLNSAISTLVKNKYDFLMSRKITEYLRTSFDIFDERHQDDLNVFGSDLAIGVPTTKAIPISVVREAVKDQLYQILVDIYSLLERTPPEVRRAITKNGIQLTGGMANIKGFDKYIENALNIKTYSATEPEFTSVLGLKRIIGDKELSKLAFSMLDESYRWMR